MNYKNKLKCGITAGILAGLLLYGCSNGSNTNNGTGGGSGLISTAVSADEIPSLCHLGICIESETEEVLANVIKEGNIYSLFNAVDGDCSISNNNFEAQLYQKDQVNIHKDQPGLLDRLTINTRKTLQKVQFCNNPNSSFVSARINTANKFTFTNKNNALILKGGVEVTAAVPYGKGLWPAIWMMPLNLNWPTGMELDIMEFQSYNDQGAPLGSHVHYGFNDGKTLPYIWNYSGNDADGLYMLRLSDATPFTPTTMHNYGFTWDCAGYRQVCDLKWYVDGENYLTMHLDPVSSNSYMLDSQGVEKPFVNRPPSGNPWDKRPENPAAAAYTSLWAGLDQGYYLILNVATGGNGLAPNNQPDWNTFTNTTMDVFEIKRYILK